MLIPALVDEGASGALAREILEADGDLHAPYLLDVEVVSGLRGLVRGKVLTAARAEHAMADYDDLAMTRYAHLGLIPRIWQLRDNLTAYDATYVALAEALDCALLTADGRLTAAAGPRCAVRFIGPDEGAA
ncbi:MAG: type II toxin-antitoxin system VapC family toxin [Sporichthyaceae bacterium]|nr:type II toxin-antitoxin system VapC family toxin [Sporichthyaceae bacterium]